MKKQNGITLIALAITIVVLLILVGVSISNITGDEGIVTKAKSAKSETEAAQAQEDEDIGEIYDFIETNGGSQEEDSSEDSNEEVVVPVVGFTVVFLLLAGSTFKTKDNVTSLELPADKPIRDGYEFTGWYYDATGTNQAKDGDTITADTNIYAGWKENEATIANAIVEIEPSHGSSFQPDVYGYMVGYNEYSTVATYTTSKQVSSGKVEILSDTLAGTENAFSVSDFLFDIQGLTVYLGTTYESELYQDDLATLKVTLTYEDGSYDEHEFSLGIRYGCLAEGTKIKLANGNYKNIEDITYEDELLVWDFDNGCLSSSKPLWIMEKHTTSEYNLLKFENGLELKTIDQHRIFNKDLGKFTYPMTDETLVGTVTVTSDGTESKLISKEVINEKVNYYNIITDYHMNLFASDILTSCRLSNLYEIKDMKYKKDERKLASKEEYPNIPEEYFKGLRIAEQPKEVNRGNDNKHDENLEGYVQRIIKSKK